MAQIDLQKKEPSSGLGWLWALLAVAAVAGIVLFFVFNGEGDDDEVGAGVEVAAVDPDNSSDDFEDEDEDENAAQDDDTSERFPLAAVMANPEEWNGRTVNGEVTVGAVPTDRGFWVEEDGRQAFFLVDPVGEESEAHIQQGQRLRISGATVHRELSSVGEVEDEARAIIEDQAAFFVVDPSDFQIL